MLYYDRIYISEVIDLAKNNNSQECMTCCYFFFSHGFEFRYYITFFARIMSCSNYKQYSLLIKSKGMITIKHGTIQIQYP